MIPLLVHSKWAVAPYAWVVYVDVRKMRWWSLGSVAFYSFVWPRKARDAKSFINHCNWRGVLIVRGRCFCSHKSCHAASGVLENLLWHWCKTDRPYLVCKEGSKETGGGDPIPGWLSTRCRGDFCQCNLVGRNNAFNGQGWQYPGSLYSNMNMHLENLNLHAQHVGNASRAVTMGLSAITHLIVIQRIQ